jgi:hypothetical protein
MTETNNQAHWLQGEIMDMTSLPEAQQKLAANYKKPITDSERWADQFGGIDQAAEKAKVKDSDFSEQDLEQLALRDPEFKRKWEEMKMDEVTAAFKKANPNYIANAKNYSEIIGHIKRHQLSDAETDMDDVIEAAFHEGHWTEENLTGTFKVLARQGRMQMPAGKIKTLTKEEQLRVISFVRHNDLQGAIVEFLTLSYGGVFPEGYRTVGELLVAQPDLSARASWFVWEHATAGHFNSPNEFRAFKRANAHLPLPTFEVLEIAYLNWKERGQNQQQTQPQQTQPQPAPVPVDLNKLTDAELDAVIAEERKSYFRNR